MKRLIALGLLTLALATGCTSSTREFEERGGVCYRTETDRVMGIKTHSQEVQSVAANCRGE